MNIPVIMFLFYHFKMWNVDVGEPCSNSLDSLNGFPSIKLLFRKLNATLPSSAPVERLFSKASLISSPRRNRLNDQKNEELLLLKANSKWLTVLNKFLPWQDVYSNFVSPYFCSAVVTLNF